MSQQHSHPTIDPAKLTLPEGHAWNRLPLIGSVIGVIGLVIFWRRWIQLCEKRQRRQIIRLDRRYIQSAVRRLFDVGTEANCPRN